jgi:hypothetical protein
VADYFKKNANLFAQRAQPGMMNPQIGGPAPAPMPGGVGAAPPMNSPMPMSQGMGAPGQQGPQGMPEPPQTPGGPQMPVDVSGYAEPGSLLQFVNPSQLKGAPAAQPQSNLQDMAHQLAGLNLQTPEQGMFTAPWNSRGFDKTTRGGGKGKGPVDNLDDYLPDDFDNGSFYEGQNRDGTEPWNTAPGDNNDGGAGYAYASTPGSPDQTDEYMNEIKNLMGEGSFDPIEEGILNQRDEAARNMFEAMAGRGMSQSGAAAGMAGDIYRKGYQDVAQAETAYNMQKTQQMMGLLGMMFQDKWRTLDRQQQITLANLAAQNQLWLSKALTALQNEQPGEIEGLLDELKGLEVGGINASWGAGVPDFWNWGKYF